MRLPVLALLLALPGQAMAVSVSVTWTGTVTQASFDPGLVGQTVTGAFDFDTTGVTPTVFDFPFGGQQANSFTRHRSSFSVGGLSGARDGQFIRITDNNGNLNFDQLASSELSGSYSGDLVGGEEIDQIFVPLTGSVSAFDGIGIPESLSQDDFDFRIFGVLARGDDNVLANDVQFQLTGFTYAAGGTGQVPLPATAALLLAALGALAATGARRRA